MSNFFKTLSPEWKKRVRNLAAFFVFDLNKLAKIYGSDKYGSHFYTVHYHRFFKKLRYKSVKVLEIGVGGYDDPKAGGGSLRMWRKYFPFGKIYSIDIYDKSFHEERRIKIVKGSQVDNILMKEIGTKYGPFDIIIDDGSHINEHVIESFKIMFPFLKSNGYYAVEDVQTSYWAHMGGASKNDTQANTSMNFIKKLTDGLNYEEFEDEDYKPSEFDKNIVGIHFFHNLVFFEKGENNEGSNKARLNG